jgi:hypothetical protein
LLAVGKDSIIASYAGDENYSQTASSAVSISVAMATPTVTVMPSSSSITTTQALTVTVAVTGGAGAPLVTGSVTLTSGSYTSAPTRLSSGSATISIPAGSLAMGNDTLSVSYITDSNSSTIYTSSTGVSSQITVSQTATTPRINWATPAAITYGTALGAAQLNASSPLAGGFAYTPVAGTVLTAGPQTLTATFTPTDTTDYKTASTTVTLTVNQATPTLTWATPSAVAYGTALSATQLNATASVPGNFVYNPALGAIPSAGNDTLSVTFTPTDAVDYTTATASVALTVNPNPSPFLGNITPAIADAGGAAFTITVNGANFLPNSTVFWGTSALATQFVNAAQLTASVTAADITTAGATAISVQTPAPGGGTSDILQFEVDPAGASANAPTLPSTTVSVTAGSTATYQISFPANVTSATVSCLNLPTGALCSFSSTSNLLTVSTSSATPAGTYQVTAVFNETVTSTTSANILLPFLLLPLIFLRKKLTRRGAWITACVGLVVLASTATIVGCGGGGSSTTNQQPPPQTYQVVSSGTVTLTVQ